MHQVAENSVVGLGARGGHSGIHVAKPTDSSKFLETEDSLLASRN